ncbi:MAG: Gfo/Idh/MocA family oxidoreductase [Verrucomicrobiales bacterium]
MENSPAPASISRRRLLGTAAGAVAGFTIVPRHVLGGPRHIPPSEKLNVAGIGVGGQGGSDIAKMAGENVIALCDVDAKRAAGSFKKFEKAERFEDFRVMLEKVKGIDAVVIGTPDHIHAPAAVAAMQLGKHVYVEKPMAHTIYETRRMRDVAREAKVVTQMGNQGHAGEGLRLTKEWIQAGAIGKVTEVHCWSDRPGKFWRQDVPVPEKGQPVRDGLNWDLWLGPAAFRDYHEVYCPRAWRGWWDFGCGAIGDMAVHNADPAFYALDLDPPIAAEAQTAPVNPNTLPLWNIIHLYFAAKGDQPAVRFTWYDGGKQPPRPEGLEKERELGDNGIYFVGDKGVILCGGWAGTPRLVPESAMQAFQRPEKSIPRSPGHHEEWIAACKANKPEDAKAGFDYSAPFTESLFVGNLAARLGKRIEWDSANMKATNAPEADPLINKAYRDGFAV